MCLPSKCEIHWAMQVHFQNMAISFIRTSVCKILPWPRKHLSLQLSQPYVATFTTKSCGNDGIATKLNVPWKLFNEFLPVQGSCHGLLLLIPFYDHGLRLLNPITQEVVEIQFDWRGHMITFGLVYDSCTDDFKVVRIQKDDIHVYSVKNRTWRTLPNSSPFCYDGNTVSQKVVFVDGRLNFMSRATCVKLSYVIAVFNLGTKEFESVSYPKGFGSLRGFGDRLTILGGCLAMVVRVSTTSFDMWLIKEYGVQDSWTKFTIDHPYGSMRPLCLLGEDEIVLNQMHRTRLVRYNLRNGVWRDMVVNGAPNSIRWTSVTSFRESLVSPNYK